MRIVLPTSIAIALVAAALCAQDPASRPAEVYTSIPLSELELIEGKWPEEGRIERTHRWFSPGPEATEVALGPSTEGFVGETPADPDTGVRPGPKRLVLRSPPGKDVTGAISLVDWNGDANVRIRVPKELVGNAIRSEYVLAAREHYRAHLGARIPGGAWFRHRLRECDAELGKEETPDRPRFPGSERWRNRDDLSETYELFSAGRAVSENLRLDRELVPIDGGEPTISIDAIQGITTKAFDWKAAVAGLSPAKDPLASKIPEDQHAAFFPNLGSLLAVLEAIDAHAPLLHAAEDRSEDVGARAFYESQLGISSKELAAAEVAKTIGAIAVTGSDPYFRTGTDVAILFECSQPEALKAWIDARHASIASSNKDVAVTTGQRLSGIATEDRAVSSFVTVIDGAVVVTNSPEQLDRIKAAAGGAGSAPLAASPEYVFFRDRYRRGDPAETAFLILTDATIRRWCGPRWRIADARRTRGAALISGLTARHAETIVRDRRAAPSLESEVPSLGRLALTPIGIHSDLYGSLRFLRPIVSMKVPLVTQAEEAAYSRFRETYQQRWVNFFDPIAVRLELSASQTAIDTTVMPLVESTEYRWLMEMARAVRFSPTACDPHASAAVQLVLAVDAAAAAMEPWDRGSRRLIPNLEGLALSWLKGGVSLSLDEDPVLETLKAAEGWEARANLIPRLPLLLTAEVKDPVALALFLTGIRTAIDETSLGSIKWTKAPYRDVETMTISGLEGVSSRSDRIAIRYAIADETLFVSLREDVLHHAIDRVLDRRAGKTVAGARWLGGSAALTVGKSFASLVAEWGRERQDEEEALAFGALPILNEWRRLYPDQDPVAVHEKLFKVRLMDPAGGRYVVDPASGWIVSETYGRPTATRPGPKSLPILEGFKEARGGLTFENDGVRARLVIEREGK